MGITMIPPRVGISMMPPRVGISMMSPRVGISMMTPRVGISMMTPRVGISMMTPSINQSSSINLRRSIFEEGLICSLNGGEQRKAKSSPKSPIDGAAQRKVR